MSLLDREQIVSLLQALSAELERRGTRAEIFLIGGAAMALAYDARRATRDLDAVFQPKDEVYAAAAAVARGAACRMTGSTTPSRASYPEATRRPVRSSRRTAFESTSHPRSTCSR